MRRNNKWIHGLYVLIAACLFLSCSYRHPDYTDTWDMTPSRRDSIEFVKTHHYTINFNFEVTGDSLVLLRQSPRDRDVIYDSCVVYKGDKLVVADINKVSGDAIDSIWIKVARDQETMGWTRESVLLKKVIPNDPISFFIHVFSNQHLVYFLCLLAVAISFYLYRAVRRNKLHIVHFNDINTFYPTLLCMLVAGAATLYASVQHFVPDTWVEFYFHPTLNPFGLPFVLSCFLLFVWLIIIVFLAVVDDVKRQLGWGGTFPYLLGLAGVCMVLYLFFTFFTLIYIGYVFLFLYWCMALVWYNRHFGYRYLCGKCGQKLRKKGTCPHCGAYNN